MTGMRLLGLQRSSMAARRSQPHDAINRPREIGPACHLQASRLYRLRVARSQSLILSGIAQSSDSSKPSGLGMP